MAASSRIIPVDTPLMVSVHFDAHTSSFSIFYRDGHISRFTKVSPALFQEFMESPAKDAFFRGRILNRFSEEKIA